MEALHAIILGIVEGLTEFLPISSTGHLLIAEHYIHFKDTAEIFTVSIQAGSIAAVIWHYHNDLWRKISGFFSGQAKARHFIYNVTIATIPALILGFILKDTVDKYSTLNVVGWALIIGAVFLWTADKKDLVKKENREADLESVTTKQALIAGLAQCFALVPGVSRSGATIVGGLYSGMNRVTATAFSFYLAIPVLVLASVYKLFHGRHDFGGSVDGGGLSIILGIIVTFIVALMAISWLLRYVSTHNFRLFVYYRIIVGVLVLLAIH